MSRTIEAIMRHMAPPSSRVTDRSEQSREAGKGNHGKKAALHLVGSEIRAHHAPVSLLRPASACNGKEVDGKSVLELMMLAPREGSTARMQF